MQKKKSKARAEQQKNIKEKQKNEKMVLFAAEGRGQKVGVCMEGTYIAYVTYYNAESGCRVYGDIEAWSEEDKCYIPWYYVQKHLTLGEIKIGLKAGTLRAG